MAIATVCPACGQKGEAPDAVQGLRLKCPTCGHTFKAIGAPSPEPASNSDSSWNSSTKEQKDLDTIKAPMPQEQYVAEPPANSAPIIPPRPPLRYPALRAIAAVNEALGFFTLILGLASIFLVLVASASPSKEFFVYAFAWTVLVPIGFFASAQLLRVFLDIEENTRYQGMLLSALLDHVAKVQASRQPGE